MTLTIDMVKKVAHLARLAANDDDLIKYQKSLSSILNLIEQMNAVDTTDVLPMAHPLEEHQVFRPDQISEPNQREAFQKIAPLVRYGLYLVPKVIE